jgi:putative ABC transport system permease protein
MQMPVALPRQLSRLPAPNRWLWLVAVSLLAVVGAIGYLRWTTPVAAPVQGQHVPVRRGTITQTFTILLGSIAGISLVVGGIGIMNIMLVSVTERTREIGIRKAVGARRKDILSQFLVESVMVSLLGGAVGVVLGWGISRMIAGMPMPGSTGASQALQTVVTPESVLLAFGVSAVVGIFFGIYPASRAARLHPIQALRYE